MTTRSPSGLTLLRARQREPGFVGKYRLKIYSAEKVEARSNKISKCAQGDKNRSTEIGLEGQPMSFMKRPPAEPLSLHLYIGGC